MLQTLRAMAWFVVLGLLLGQGEARADSSWQGCLAPVSITPEEPMWMSGYASRKAPAEGTYHDLWAKALVLDDGAGGRLVLITTDLVGIERDVALRVRSAVAKKYNVDLAAVALNTSHTHCGPVVGNNLGSMYFLDEFQQDRVNRYTAALEGKLQDVVDRAMESVAPAVVSWGTARATFAVNRRNNNQREIPALRAAHQLKGPSDHDVAVLTVTAPDGVVRGVIVGYACHATTLSFQQWCGDYPGFMQLLLEQNHPGSIALFWAGCGADQNPLPRHTVELAQEYGHRLADAAESAMATTMHPISGRLSAAYREIDLPLASLPSRSELEAELNSSNRYEATRAKMLLAQIDAGKPLSPTYPYPVQVWRLGNGPVWVTLGGEVVVDYSLRLKQELGSAPVWVAGYTNDVMAYIPSRRVLLEGGYEGGTSMVYYGLPAHWAPEVEELIVGEVRRQVASLGTGSAKHQP